MSVVFDKSEDLFPIKSDQIFLSHCGISPLYGPAAEQAIGLIREQQLRGGGGLIEVYEQWMNGLRAQAALLLGTQPENMAFVRNTSEAMSMLANGYPFEPGDEVITFVQEYPANYYPWILQERRGVTVKFLSNIPAAGDIPQEVIGKWSERELLELISPKTRVIALSHVQFTSGYAANLQRLGEICKEYDIDLVIDAAQSMGCMPLYPENWNVAAVASAGWKWLLGPVGAGIFYTRPDFRDKIAITQIGVETMLQTYDFLDLSWAPTPTARRFEYSTSPIQLVAALTTCLKDLHVHYGSEAIFREAIRLQDVFLGALNNPILTPLLFDAAHRSGILTLYCEQEKIVLDMLKEAGITCSGRGRLIRVAPHFYNTDEEMLRLAELLNGWRG
ncbi:MAG: aminotransferase class V-fold PLP-dependent enzyme [Saprospiraceae bacterium]|nr:aminotransferase class V-fold PLP-dependent enzyme [Lewinella sp.]